MDYYQGDFSKASYKAVIDVNRDYLMHVSIITRQGYLYIYFLSSVGSTFFGSSSLRTSTKS